MFVVGDQVAVLDDALSGKVIKVTGNEVTVEDTDGFVILFDQSELVKIESEELLLRSDTDIEEILKEKETPQKPKPRASARKKKEIPPMEVDLHIEKLTKSHKRMSNYEILTLQVDTAKGQLHFALEKRIQRIIFIHGVGAGVLKAELEYLFRQYDHIKVSDGDYQKYGAGAIEVYVLQRGM